MTERRDRAAEPGGGLQSMSLERDRCVAVRELLAYDPAAQHACCDRAVPMPSAAATVRASGIARGQSAPAVRNKKQASKRSMKLRRLREVAWLSLCVVVFAAIAPAITHAIARSAGLASYSELCSASDAKRLALDPSSTSIPPDDLRSPIHCPFCRLQDYAPALPAPDLAFVAAGAVGEAPALTDVPAPPIDQPRSRVRARAPPTFS